MKKYIFFVLLINFLAIQSSIGQQNYAWRLGISAGINNYHGDLSQQLISNPYAIRQLDAQSFPGKLQASLEYQFSPSWGISLQAGYGSLSGNDRAKDWKGNLLTENPNFERALNFRTEIKDANLSLVYHFNNDRILRREAKIAPYIYVGAGLTYFRVYGDLFNEDGGRYYYWPDQTIRGTVYDPITDPEPPIIQQDGDFETELGPLHTESDEGYYPLIIQIPIGLGVDFRLSERILLGFQAQVNYAFSDYLDDVSGNYRTDLADLSIQNYAGNPSMINTNLTPNRGNPNGQNDWYSFLAVSIKYQFGGKVKSYNSPKFYGLTHHFEAIDTTEIEEVFNKTEIEEEVEEPLVEVTLGELDIKPELRENDEKVENSREENLVATLDSTLEKAPIEQTIEIKEKNVEKDLAKREDELDKNRQTLDSLANKIDHLEKVNKDIVKSEFIPFDSTKTEVKALQKEVKDLASRVEKLENEPDSIFVAYKPKVEKIEKAVFVDSTKTKKLIKEQKKIASQSIRKDSTKQKAEPISSNPVIIPSRGNDTLSKKIEKPLANTQAEDSLIISPKFKKILITTEAETPPITSMDSIENNVLDSLQIAVKDTLHIVPKTTNVPIDTFAKPLSNSIDSIIIDSFQLNSELVFMADEKQKPEIEAPIFIKPNTSFVVDTVKINEILGLNKAQIFFSLGSSLIRKSEEETLLATAEILKKNPKINVLIKGFADPSGNAQRNLILSQKRAEATSTFLVTQGISQDRIRIERFGDTVQRYGEGALDRRVELELIMN